MQNRGLTYEQVIRSRELNGRNELPAPERDAWYVLLFDKFKDPLIIVLLIAALISGILGFIEGSLIETIGVCSAILIATLVGFWSDYSSQKKFDALNSLNQATKVMTERSNGIDMIDQRELVVGDIVHLKQGDEVPADCKIIESVNLHINESSLTGESVPAEKGLNIESHGAYPADFLLKSTIITEGTCIAVVTAVGVSTEIGKVAQESSFDLDEKTPLTKQLDRLGDFITKAAFSIAGLLIICLGCFYYFNGEYVGKSTLEIVNDVLKFFMIAVTLVVVAVPEGLPMAVVIALSHSMKALIKDNNLIKNLHACETMGAVSVIVTDKTGTLTENKMVVKDYKIIDGSEVDFKKSLVINNSAELNTEGKAIGNPTDAALLNKFLILDKPIADEVIPFTSDTKCMQSTYEGVVYIKGAIEVISTKCSIPEEFFTYADIEASKGNRVITTMQIVDSEKKEFLGCVSIEDPIRSDVPAAIKECRDAGIEVIMATGDNIVTATEIGKQAGIDADKVVARCTPSKKVELATEAKAAGKVVAMLGDGTNDAPAMNISDVGVSVGSGTAIAKEAADVVLMDDSFVSIVKGIKFGRSLYKNIQKFIIFQSTINVVAVVIAFLGQFFDVSIPLTVTQMLWVNLIMDTLAALALSTTSNDGVMSEQPRNPKAFIIDRYMTIDILSKGLVYIVILLACLNRISLTEFFCTFVLLQWWNMFSCRHIGKGNIFKGLLENKLFIIVSLIILVGQYFITEFGGEVFRTESIGIVNFLKLLGLTSIPFIFFEIVRFFRK